MKMRFFIPDFSKHWELNLNLIDMIREHPEYFHEGVEIGACFGAFPPALWNGGRALFGYSSREQISNTLRLFNERGVPLRYTFTNPTITEKDLKDPFCNRICKESNNGFNEIICNSPVLEEYIRKTYPEYPLISSTCKEIRDIDGVIAELEKDYKLVVLDYNWNNRFDMLAQIPEEYRSRCEILVNPWCVPNCQKRGAHYQYLGECQRQASTNPRGQGIDKFAPKHCLNTYRNFYDIQKYCTFVPFENLEKYMELGYNNFKIEGRTLLMAAVAESYIYYMVKPEYKDYVRMELMCAAPRQPIVSPIPGIVGQALNRS